jgi:hypothetical protein
MKEHFLQFLVVVNNEDFKCLKNSVQDIFLNKNNEVCYWKHTIKRNTDFRDF